MGTNIFSSTTQKKKPVNYNNVYSSSANANTSTNNGPVYNAPSTVYSAPKKITLSGVSGLNTGDGSINSAQSNRLYVAGTTPPPNQQITKPVQKQTTSNQWNLPNGSGQVQGTPSTSGLSIAGQNTNKITMPKVTTPSTTPYGPAIPQGFTKPADKNTTPTNTPTAYETYLASLTKSGEDRSALLQKQQKDYEDYIKAQYGLLNTGLDQSAGQYVDAFNRFKTNSEGEIKDIQATGDIQKSNAKDYYGDAQLKAAKSRDQVRGQTQRTFSNLGTIDSRGEGSFAQATENQDSAFNSFTQGNLKAEAQRMTEIDMAVGDAVRKATLAVQEEESKLKGLLDQITLAKSQNNLDQAQGLIQAYNDTQQKIYDIQDGIENIKYQYQLEQEKFKATQDQLTQETAGLSPGFMQTGEPENMNDFIYRSKHPEMFNKIGSSSKGKNASALQVEGKAGAGLRALQTIESEILNNPNILAQAAIPGSPGARQYDAAISSITDAIGGLRTGASVSPEQQAYYRKMLPTVGDSPETISYKLNSIRQELEGYAQGANNMSSDIPPELMTLLGL